MCGIAGLILRHGSPHPRMLATAAARLAHRGPDDSGIWCKDASASPIHASPSSISVADASRSMIQRVSTR